MSVPDAGLPFFGVQAGARGERVSLEEKAVELTPVEPTNLTGRADGVDDVVQVAAALAVMLYRYTYEPTIVIGIAPGDLRTEEAHGVGVIPMSVSVDAQHTLDQVISRIAKAAREARGKGAQPGSVAAPDRPTPVVVTVRPPADAGSALSADQGRSRRYARMLRTTDLVIEIDKERGATTLRLIYDGPRFDGACMERFGEQIATALASLAADATQPVKDAAILPEAERRRLLLECCPGDTAPRPEKTVIDLLEEQCARTPDRRAYICDDEPFTYEQVNGKANSLARELHEMGVVKGDFIPLLLDQTLDLIVSALALMKLGAVFVPLDLKWPATRIHRLVTELAPRAILMDEGVTLAGTTTAPARPVDWFALPVSATGPRNAVAPDDPIYGYYTSGSTGMPKCAINIHRGIVNRFLYMTKRYRATGDEVILQNSKHVFDAWVWQVFWPLTTGAMAILPRSTKVFDLLGRIEMVAKYEVTMTDFVPSVFGVLVDYLTNVNPGARGKIKTLRHILIGGEELNPVATQAFKSMLPHVGLTNTYGPTETSIGTIFFEIGKERYSSIPIGRPIDNVNAFILDEHLNLMPTGAIGDLYLSGACMGLGYLNDPEKTRSVFLPNPYQEVAGTIMYRTGDLAYYLPDRNIQFVGRRDQQVKVRGIRIELGEIESVLLEHPEVKQAKVVLDKRVAGREELVGYVVGRRSRVDVMALRSHLRLRLPDYMVPVRFGVLEAMPLDHSGKVDRKRLLEHAATEGAATRVDDPFSPRTKEEARLAEIWKDTLNVNSVSTSDSFFDLGGNSLLGVRLLWQIREALGVDIPIQELYQRPTIGELRQALKGAGKHATGLNEKTMTQIATDLKLADDVHGNGGAKTAPVELQHVLLTGATGFVGAHLLKELLEKTDAVVYCLVRAHGEVGALIRLRENLQYYGFDAREYLPRIVCIAGDLAWPRFGLPEEDYRDHSQRIDTVMHSGALVDYLRDYGGHRSANVLGTVEILRFAGNGRPKFLHHVSTLGVLPLGELALSGLTFSEDSPLETRYLPDGGYSQSKWAADQLATRARARGLPVNVFRPGEVMPATDLGAPNRKALSHMVIKAFLALGMYPETDAVLDYTPADYVGRAIVHIAKRSTAPGATYHLRHPMGIPVRQVLQVFRSAGFALEEVSYARFWKQLEDAGQAAGGDSELTLLRSLVAGGASLGADRGPTRDILRELFDLDVARVLNGKAVSALESSGIELPDDADRLIRPYADHCKRHGEGTRAELAR
jgi:amino acid adenylation domain-containing protein/thioester reductase-like protein